MAREALGDTDQEHQQALVAYNNAIRDSSARDVELDEVASARDAALSNPQLSQAQIDPIKNAWAQARARRDDAEQLYQSTRDTFEAVEHRRRHRRAYLTSQRHSRDPTKQVTAFPHAANATLPVIAACHLDEINDTWATGNDRHFWQFVAPGNVDTTDLDLRRRINQTKNCHNYDCYLP